MISVFLTHIAKILVTFHKAEAILNDQYDGEPPESDTNSRQLAGDAQSASVDTAHGNVQLVHERTYQRITAKIREWRKSTAANERKRFAQALSDMCVNVKLPHKSNFRANPHQT